MKVLDVVDTEAGSAQQLAGFLAAVSSSPDVRTAMVVAAERARLALGADLATVTRGTTSVSSDTPAGVPNETLSVTLDGPEGGEMRVMRNEGAYSANDRVVLESMAKVLVMAVRLLENREQERDLLASLQERQALLERLARIQRSIFHRAPIREVLATICTGAAELLGDDCIGLRLLDRDDPTQLVMASSVGVRPDSVRPDWRTKVGEGVGGRAVSEGRLVVVEDYASADFHMPAFAVDGITAAMAAPVFEAGQIVGSLTVATHAPGRRYSQAERDVLRLSSKSHWDVTLNIGGTLVHALVSHPTPPVFDGTEDRNGKRNHDEIRF
ncbi:MAG: GAF domain-containing protein, partial [Actinomycetota bacterium]|nr:GAF domain-containing protein [Actinomycetota bacterium]